MNTFIKGDAMPKIIENVKEQLLCEAKKQIRERGYSGMTVRSVASACGLGVGTVYNYFSSKDMLIASFILEDWQGMLDGIRKKACSDKRDALLLVYDSLKGFMTLNEALFSDCDAKTSFNAYHLKYHKLLRKQIAETIAPVLNKTGDNNAFLPEFVAESLLTWTVEGKSFDDIYSLLESIIK